RGCVLDPPGRVGASGRQGWCMDKLQWRLMNSHR
ncbi:hypothetical protein LINPERHAP2_LOCUS3957, partial [Linum perenne]